MPNTNDKSVISRMMAMTHDDSICCFNPVLNSGRFMANFSLPNNYDGYEANSIKNF